MSKKPHRVSRERVQSLGAQPRREYEFAYFLPFYAVSGGGAVVRVGLFAAEFPRLMIVEEWYRSTTLA